MRQRIDRIDRKFEKVMADRNVFIGKVTSNLLSSHYMQDLSRDVMPYPYGNRKNKLAVNVSPPSQRDFCVSLFGSVGRRGESLEEVLANFFERTTQSLILFDKCIYELCDAQTESGTIKILESVNPESISLTEEFALQNLESGQSNMLERGKVLVIDTPSFVEGGLGFRTILEQLILESRRQYTPLPLMDAATKGELNSFSYMQFHKEHQKRVLTTTVSSGWNARNLYNEAITEYYLVCRVLRYRKTLAMIREHILKSLNTFLSGIEKYELPKVELSIDGLLNSTQVEDLSIKLENGEIPFRTIIDSFY